MVHFIKKVRFFSLLISFFPLNTLTAQSDCTYRPLVADMLGNTSPSNWYSWLQRLSGDQPIYVGGVSSLVQTRDTRAMFTGNPSARAFDYLVRELKAMHPDSLVQEQEYPFFDLTAKNLILRLPGQTQPEEYVLLTAHLDSICVSNPPIAPGANDNGAGAAALVEAARLLRRYRFARTLLLVWFTGEEQGLGGSWAFVNNFSSSGLVGVVNLDMFGWDGDKDRCFEIHAGTLPGSQALGQCFAETISSYNLDLSYDFLTDTATRNSDHASFWAKQMSAIEISENAFDNHIPNGCSVGDRNPNYHQSTDTVTLNLTPDYAFEIARTALATVASLAEPLSSCFSTAPELVMEPPGSAFPSFSWTELDETSGYRVYRAAGGCQGNWVVAAHVSSSSWADTGPTGVQLYGYRVEAVHTDGYCVSPPSNCISVDRRIFLPLILY